MGDVQAKDEPFVSLGFTVMPVHIEGTSPVKAEYTLIGSLLVEDYEIDHNDGTPVEEGKFQKNGEFVTAVIVHEYQYAKGKSKYSGKAFYPTITIRGKSPAGTPITNVFNTADKGRCLTVLVNSIPPA